VRRRVSSAAASLANDDQTVLLTHARRLPLLLLPQLLPAQNREVKNEMNKRCFDLGWCLPEPRCRSRSSLAFTKKIAFIQHDGLVTVSVHQADKHLTGVTTHVFHPISKNPVAPSLHAQTHRAQPQRAPGQQPGNARWQHVLSEPSSTRSTTLVVVIHGVPPSRKRCIKTHNIN
jgi:hypothetical protein